MKMTSSYPKQMALCIHELFQTDEKQKEGSSVLFIFLTTAAAAACYSPHAYYVLGTVPVASHMLSYLIFITPKLVSTTAISFYR